MARDTAIDHDHHHTSTSEGHETHEPSERKQRPGLNFRSLQHFVAKFNNDWSMTFAGTLAYSLLTAIVPIMLALLSTLGFVLGSSQTHQLLKNIADLIPGFSAQVPFIEQSLDQLSHQAWFLAVIAIVMAIFGGSRLFLGLEGFLDIVYRVRPRTFIPQNIMAILMMILFIILVPIMVFASTLPGFLVNAVANYPLLKKVAFFLLASQ